MKLFIASFLLSISFYAKAQLHPIVVPALANAVNQRNLEYSRDICFDKKFSYLLIGAGVNMSTCLFVNTQNGFIGIPFSKDENSQPIACIGMDQGNPDFILTTQSLKGQTFTFVNEERKGRIEHRMSTGFSDINPLVRNNSLTRSTVLRKANITRRWTVDDLLAQAYLSNRDTIYLYGSPYPQTLTIENSLGMPGAGYLKTNRGVYAMLQFTNASNNFKVHTVDVYNLRGTNDECFYPQNFTNSDLEYYFEEKNALKKKEQKIQRERAKITQRNSACKELQLKVNQLERESNSNEKELNEQRTRENAYQMSNDFLVKSSDRIISVKSLQYLKATEELKLCQLSPDNNPCFDVQARCMERNINKIELMIVDLQRLENTYRSRPTELMKRKSNFRAERMRDLSECDFDRNCNVVHGSRGM